MKADKPTQSVEQRVRECVVSCYNISFGELKLDTELDKYGDSLDRMEFILAAEDEFRIEVDEHLDDFNNIKTLADAVAFVLMCLEKKEQAGHA